MPDSMSPCGATHWREDGGSEPVSSHEYGNSVDHPISNLVQNIISPKTYIAACLETVGKGLLL